MSKIDLRQLYNDIAHQEGKKHQASVGDVREVCRLLLAGLKQEVKNGNGEAVAKLLGLKARIE